jgi:hypothetical protein
MRALGGLLALAALMGQAPRPFDAEPFSPRQAICYRAAASLAIDGRLDEVSWRAAPWSEPFVDIESDIRPKPTLLTRVKMLWDDEYLYLGADLAEPQVWATLTARESVIFHENDFEVFIDPDGDTHEYYELEINALNTVWDLLLVRPYRDGGPALNAWDIAGLKTAVHVRGTLNRPGDTDDGWSVEIAMPWKILREAAPGSRPPRAGDRWRVNFSRVQWPLDVMDGKYVKRTDAAGKPLPEHNWVWSPQGAIAMHMPERWGAVQFSSVVAGQGVDRFVADPDDAVKWALRRLYYRQAEFRRANGRYARTLKELNPSDVDVTATLHATEDLYVLTAPAPSGGTIYLRQDGRVWTQKR